MKKYLMMGMAAVAFASVLSSCSKEDAVEQKTQMQINKENYELAFINKFCAKYGTSIAPNQDWGFGSRAKTRGVNVNGNEWKECPSVTEEEIELVFNHVNKDKSEVVGAMTKFPKNITDYWVTQVYSGTDTYNSNDGTTTGVLGSDHMDHLQIAEVSTAKINADGTLTDGWYHVNNFNSGDNTDWNGNTAVYDSGTFDFAYNNSEDSRYHNKWIAVPGEKIDASLKGYFYICFDFEAINSGYTVFRFKVPGNNPGEWVEHTANVSGEWTVASATAAGVQVSYTEQVWNNETQSLEEVTRTYTVGQEGTTGWSIDNVVGGNMGITGDNVYTDWIIRLVPAEDEEPEYVDRIICEDLGAVGDFDFNDLVFDVRYADGGAYVKLRNVGGTLPLYIDEVKPENEVHEICGAQINPTTGLYPILYSVNPDEIFLSGVEEAGAIAIIVDGTYINKKGQVKQDNAEAEELDPSNVDNLITLKAEIGQVPQKICVDPRFEWCAEREAIDSKYEKFPVYVADPSEEWY